MSEFENQIGNNQEPNTDLVLEFACTNCAAGLKYKPGTTHLHCEYCGSDNEIPLISDPISELDFEVFLEKEIQNEPTLALNVVSCSNCGAEATVDTHIKSQSCPYCFSALVVADIHCENVILPKGLLPFKLNQKEAHDSFKKWVNKLWFAPTALKKNSLDIGKLKGMYVPYWTFDSNTSSTFVGQRGEYYYVNVTYNATENGQQVTKTRKERRTRWHNVQGNLNHFFDDVLILASRNLPYKLANGLEPWDLQNLVVFDNKFLGGFITERYQKPLKEGFESAKVKMDEQIKNLVTQKIGGDEQRILQLKTNHDNITFKHILLPIYLSGFTFKGKLFQFLVNARTGEVQGERPFSVWKIIRFILIILVLVGIVFVIANV